MGNLINISSKKQNEKLISIQNNDSQITVNVTTDDFGEFDINVAYTKKTKIQLLESKIIEHLEQMASPKKFKIWSIYNESFVGQYIKYNNGDNDAYNELMNKSIIDFDKNIIIKKGLKIRIAVKYEHKIRNQHINCKWMLQKRSKNPMDCPVYNELLKQYKFNDANYNHIVNYNHFKNGMEEKPECINNQNCHSFKRLDEGGNNIEDKCHLEIFRHPPRKRIINLQQNINSLIIHQKWTENHPLYEPSNNDKKTYLWNEKDGFLEMLIQEMIVNNYKNDLCLECNNNEECKHKEYGIVKIVNDKMKHQRHLMMDCPLNRGEMLALLLYTNCNVNYDLCNSQRNGNYEKWKWFDYC
eukprot:246133_1